MKPTKAELIELYRANAEKMEASADRNVRKRGKITRRMIARMEASK